MLKCFMGAAWDVPNERSNSEHNLFKNAKVGCINFSLPSFLIFKVQAALMPFTCLRGKYLC